MAGSMKPHNTNDWRSLRVASNDGSPLLHRIPSDMMLSRRKALMLAGGTAFGLAFAGLTGCSSGNDSDTSVGFADDCEVKSYPLTVYLYADANLKRHAGGTDLSRIEQYFSGYQDQAGRGQVSFAIKYLTSDALATFAKTGFDEGDAVIALTDTIEAGCTTGKFDGGAANSSVREFSGQLVENLIIVRAKGSNAQMPAATTIDGEDSSDGQFNKLQNLGQFDGKIAIPSIGLTEGAMTYKALAREGLYSDASGEDGSFSDDLAGKIVEYQTLEDEYNALQAGECQLGFAVESMMFGDFPNLELVYKVTRTTVTYSGCTLTCANEPGVARDFFEYVTRTI